MAFGWIYTFLSVGLLAVSAEFIWSRPVHNMARFAVSEYNKDSTDLYASKLIKIISAKVEVNDDVKYILIVEIGRTQCLKMDNMDIDICPISNFDNVICHFIVVNVPSENITKLVERNCSSGL
ncbi:cystatin-like [Erpetoichthys calabaricus]|uniref:cystatin-like n=1 Tax=Erpetoichthys calabaricus TaxID=27687 RepID=UPI0010A0A99D|nr:cystatin-like [Erpetoichthys calabaricus]